MYLTNLSEPTTKSLLIYEADSTPQNHSSWDGIGFSIHWHFMAKHFHISGICYPCWHPTDMVKGVWKDMAGTQAFSWACILYRWYGDGEPSLCFVERKTHRESWKGEESVKERFTLKENQMVPFLTGDLTLEDASTQLRQKASPDSCSHGQVQTPQQPDIASHLKSSSVPRIIIVLCCIKPELGGESLSFYEFVFFSTFEKVVSEFYFHMSVEMVCSDAYPSRTPIVVKASFYLLSWWMSSSLTKSSAGKKVLNCSNAAGLLSTAANYYHDAAPFSM